MKIILRKNDQSPDAPLYDKQDLHNLCSGWFMAQAHHRGRDIYYLINSPSDGFAHKVFAGHVSSYAEANGVVASIQIYPLSLDDVQTQIRDNQCGYHGVILVPGGDAGRAVLGPFTQQVKDHLLRPSGASSSTHPDARPG